MSVDCEEFDGPCDVYEEGVRRARKRHKCSACREPIQPGQQYHATRSLFDGSWETVKRCARCEAMFRFLGSILPGDQVCAERLDCGHPWSDNFSDPPPPEVEHLAFLTQAEAQRLLDDPKRDWEKPQQWIARVLGEAAHV
jgi:hypothetical protein